MQTIFTYPIDIDETVTLPLPRENATVQGIVLNGDSPALVVLVTGEPDWTDARQTTFRILASGRPAPDGFEYVASFFVRQPLHIFELRA